jgi:ribosomal protein S18 acetylase RimI-like enzyme
MPTLHTRLATPADLEPVAALFDAYRQFYHQAPDLPLATRFIADRMQQQQSIILVAEDDEQRLHGFCQIYPSFCSVQACAIHVLYDLFVAPTARRGGAGRLLLQAAEAHARAHGVGRMDLTTARSNLPAQALYESLGWLRDDVFFAYNRAVPA